MLGHSRTWRPDKWLVGRLPPTLQQDESRSFSKLRHMGGARSLSVARPGSIDLTPLRRDRSLTWAERGLPDLAGGEKVPESESEEESESMNRRFLGTRGGLTVDNRRR